MNIHSIGMQRATKQNFGMAKPGKNMETLMNNARMYWENDCTYSNYVDYICDRIESTLPEKTIEIQPRRDRLTRRLFDKNATCADVYLDNKRIGIVHGLNQKDPYVPLFDVYQILDRKA